MMSVKEYKHLVNKMNKFGNSLAVQWLGLHNFTVKGMCSNPGQGTKTLKAMQHSHQKKKELATTIDFN